MIPFVSFKWFRRETAFFWLGMLIIPLFWAWWTMLPRFKPWHRVVAFAWMVAYIVVALLFPQKVAAGVDAVVSHFYSFCFLAGFALWALLIIRKIGWSGLVFAWLASGGIVAPLSMMIREAMMKGSLAWFPAFFFALPVLLNLLCDEQQTREKQEWPRNLSR